MFEQTPPLKSNVNTLAELLCDRANGELSDHGYSFFQGDDAKDHWLSYERLHKSAQQIAREIHSCGRESRGAATRGREFPRAIILCSPGPAYLNALFGALYSGWIAVTAYPPRARRRDARLDVVAADSGATVALVDERTFQRREQIIKSSPSFARLHWINVDAVSSQSSEPAIIGSETSLWTPPKRLIDDVTILQYTSGSTSDPKGVCLTHRNLLTNLEMIHRAFEFEKHSDKWTVTWLPPYHDMGLIGGLLAVMYYGMCSHVMPPNAFVQKPIRWLRAMSDLRAPVSGGPNFAFDMCTDRITDAEMESLDLSDWTLAFTGAEPIRAASLERFAKRFESVGFDAHAFFPCYGMAEATLMVSGGPRHRPLKTLRPDLTAINRDAENETTTPALVSCGRICDSQRVRIARFPHDSEVDRLDGSPSPKVLPDGQIGEVLISGLNVSPGYWQKPDTNSAVFGIVVPGESGTFMRTGDLGFVKDGELYISGRVKELIIVRGRNFFPADLEAALSGADDRLIAGGAAAIEITNHRSTSLAIVHEIERPGNDDDLASLTQVIRSRLVEEFEIEPSAVALIPRRSLPKTSSGKVRRLETRRQYEQGTLQAQSHFLWKKSENAETDPINNPGNDSYMTGSLARSKPNAPTVEKSQTVITQWMVTRLADHLNIDRQDMDVRRPFSQYGLDSVTAVMIASELEDFLGGEVPATLFYESPTIEAVAQSLGAEAVAGNQTSPQERPATVAVGPTSQVSVTPDHQQSNDPAHAVAIVGMACRLPGCDDLDAFWDLLKSGRSAIRQPPPARLDCLGESSVTRLAGWLDDVDQFDAGRFNLSPMEAKWIDPQHRLLLETSWQAIENAGIDPLRLAQSHTGVFVGITQADYLRRIIRQGLPLTTYAMTGNSASMAAHRISYHFDIRGPSLSIDTACSSSLVALHQAVRGIQSGDCDSALVAGVNLILSGEVGDALTDAQMLSPDGSCHTFDASANGYVRGEGCVAIMIKPLQTAMESGDPIHAVIGSTATNQDGLTNGITAPNGDSQIRLYRSALSRAGWSPDQISRIETHGTGTPLGDPIEVAGLAQVYGQAPCQIGAVKANLGHLEAAAGLTSLLKVVLELKHRETVPQPNFRQLNPHIDLSKSEIEISTRFQPWRTSGRRAAAVSSFGFGGTNAHVLIAEPRDKVSVSLRARDLNDRSERSDKATPVVVTLSASGMKALEQTALDHASFLDARLLDSHTHDSHSPISTDRESSSDLIEFAKATQRQKTSQRYRLAITSDSSAAVAGSLRAFAGGDFSAVQLGTKPTDREIAVGFHFGDVPTGESLIANRWVTAKTLLGKQSRTFREWVEQCDQEARSTVDGSDGDGSAGAFSIPFALAKMFAAWGIMPSEVTGEGRGEWIAAAFRGDICWKEAMRKLALAKPLDSSLGDRPRNAQPNASHAKPCDVVLALGACGQHDQHSTDREKTTVGQKTTVPISLLGDDAWRECLEAVGRLFVQGVQWQWDAVETLGIQHPRWVLPGAPLERQSHWIDERKPSSKSSPSTDERSTNPRSTGEIIDHVLLARNSEQTSEIISRLVLNDYSESMRQLDSMIIEGILSALQGLRLLSRPGDQICPSFLVSNGQVDARHEKMLSRMCHWLTEAGWLQQETDQSDNQSESQKWTATTTIPDLSNFSINVSSFAKKHPLIKHEWDLVSRCIASLPEMLRGVCDPLSVLFPGGDSSSLEALYRDSPIAACSNETVAEAARSTVELLSMGKRHSNGETNSKRQIRVLEIGAGTGGTTSMVFPEIRDSIVSYTFTDASSLLVASSAARLPKDDKLEFRPLDIERSGIDQGFPARSYDLVIAANVLHATRDLRDTLANIGELICDGGQLIALEGIRPAVFLDLVFGLTDGWWRFSDKDRRSDYPLIDATQWVELLSDGGFDSPAVIPYRDSHALVANHQAVFLAGAPESLVESETFSSDSENRSITIAPENGAASLQPWIDAYQKRGEDCGTESVEGYLSQALADFLGYDEIDLDEPISSLGVDSLMALQLKNRLETDLELSVPMVAFLEGNSTRKLIQTMLARTPDSETPEPTSANGQKPVRCETTGEWTLGPMSEGQRALWLIHQRSPNSPAYNFAFAAIASLTLNHEALKTACDRLLTRHPVLRTCYRMGQQGPVRILVPHRPADVTKMDCRGWTSSQVKQWIDAEADKPFDLSTGPIIRFAHLMTDRGDVISIAMHHIAADLWSMDLLVRELREQYAKLTRRVESSKDRTDLQAVNGTQAMVIDEGFENYVAWECDLADSEEGKRLRNHWIEKLRGAQTTLELPTRYSRPAKQTFSGSSFDWTLSSQTVDRLRELSQSEQTTLFTVLLSCYQAFLSRICDQDDVLVGTIAANRGKTQWESVVGYLLNHLVIRSQIDATTDFRLLLRQSHQEVLEALGHQAYPFSRLVEELQPLREATRPPLVQTMFIWDKPRKLSKDQGANSASQLELEPIVLEQRGAPFDLTLIVFEFEDSIKLSFRYNTDLFDEPTISAFADSLQTLIDGVTRDPEQRLQTIDLVSQSQALQLSQWNETDLPYDDELTGEAIFQTQVRKTPDAIAIQTAAGSLTYREVDQRAAILAETLAGHSIGNGAIVGLMMGRGADAIISILAIWKAGAAYLPLDPDYPTTRLAWICEDAKPVALISQAAHLERHPLVFDGHIFDIDEAPTPNGRVPVFHRSADPKTPAYVIYTSGSTGRPKGVVVSHAGLANMAAAQKECFGITPNDRCLQFASLSFDASVFEMMMAFHAGAALVTLDGGIMRSTMTDIAHSIRELGVTVATLPPPVLLAMPADDLPQLRTVVSAGEACSYEIVEKWNRGSDGISVRTVFNAYGPTEATVWSTTHRCEIDGLAPPLGRPIPNVQTYVIDRHFMATPPGVPGELCLAGPGLALEYLGRPDITAEAFLPNPFSDSHDATLYRTGDRACLRADGTLEYLGRIDDQVKIDGHRIEPGEIAATIRRIDGVVDAFVLASGDDGKKKLVAYVVGHVDPATESKGMGTSELRKTLADEVPCYLVPAQFVWVPELPLNANGKVDISRLPDPKPIPRKETGGVCRGVPPSSATEKALSEVWKKVLQLEEISVGDNFFELGGASLQALEAADLATRQGMPVLAEQMFQYQTIAKLAAAIGKAEDEKVEIGNPEIGNAQTGRAPIGPPAINEHDSMPQTAVPINAATQQASEHSFLQDPAITDPESKAITPTTSHTIARMVVESLGTFLPPQEISTQEVIQGCDRRLEFPLEKMTGIQSRHVGGCEYFSIDIARLAARDCLSRSRHSAEQIDLLIACNISRYDGPDHQVSYEPSTASKLKHDLGASSALAFDIGNACAGFFTALSVAQAKLLSGECRVAMIVSGEYITHLTETAQREIDGFLDPRLACLTLGDAGAAVIVELNEDGDGFEAIDLYTAGKHHDLCVAKATDREHGGAIMLTDAVRASAVTLGHAVHHAHRSLQSHRWASDEIDHVIMHQTSTTTLEGAMEELNRHFGSEVCTPENTVNNLTRRGNTASTTHWIAVMDSIVSGRIQSGDRTVFAISGSGQTIGTALYRFDDLPKRIASGVSPDATKANKLCLWKPHPKKGVRIVAAHVYQPPEDFDSSAPEFSSYAVVEWAARAAQSALAAMRWPANAVELLVHAGIYRDDFLSEPAVASIVAGALQMNDDVPDESGRQTLAFDVADGARGPLSACDIAATLIRSGRMTRALVTASEIENNPLRLGQRRIQTCGSAIALAADDDPRIGMGEYYHRSFPEHASKLTAVTARSANGMKLSVHQHADYSAAILQCIGDTVFDFLNHVDGERHERNGCLHPRLSQYDRILICAPSGLKAVDFQSRWRAGEGKIVVCQSPSADPFTSGLAAIWKMMVSDQMNILNRNDALAGQSWLVVAAGSGIEVGVMEYQH